MVETMLNPEDFIIVSDKDYEEDDIAEIFPDD